MRPLIWYEFTPDEASLNRLEAHAQVITGGSVFDHNNVFAVVIASLINANGEFMDRVGPSLRAILRPGIGVDNVDLEAATQRGILVINTPDAPTEATAEHTVGLLLAVAKRIVTGSRFLQTNDFPRTELLGTEVRDRVLGVIGCGRIGRRVAEICGLGLRMKIVAYDPFITNLELPGVEFTTDLNDLLQRADFLTLHIPLTAQTRHFIGEAQIRRMKHGAYLINAARGPVVDEKALIQALQDGHLAGAAVDVFDPEPPLADNPLLHMNNVVCTPHTAAYTDRGHVLSRTSITEQLIQLTQSQRPPFIVNAQAWPGRMGEGNL